MNDARFMGVAVKSAEKGIAEGQTPFGACIVRGSKIISRAHNRVWADLDITAHAEIVAIRKACGALKTVDLSGCYIYSTCEPCPMCYSACHWAGISGIVYGAEIEDAKDYGFNELFIPSQVMSGFDGSGMAIREGVLKEACIGLFKIWALRKDRRVY